MTQYEIKSVLNPEGVEVEYLYREDGAQIPLDPANSDYQAYLDRDKPKAALSTPIVNEAKAK